MTSSRRTPRSTDRSFTRPALAPGLIAAVVLFVGIALMGQTAFTFTSWAVTVLALIIVVFAVVVIGGLGSILGAVVAGFLVGLVEAFGQAYAPTFSQVLIFVLMALVILFKPTGLFGREESK